MRNNQQRIHGYWQFYQGIDPDTGGRIYVQLPRESDPYIAIDFCAFIGFETILFEGLSFYGRVGWGFAFYKEQIGWLITGGYPPNDSEGQKIFATCGFNYRFDLSKKK